MIHEHWLTILSAYITETCFVDIQKWLQKWKTKTEYITYITKPISNVFKTPLQNPFVRTSSTFLKLTYLMAVVLRLCFKIFNQQLWFEWCCVWFDFKRRFVVWNREVPLAADPDVKIWQAFPNNLEVATGNDIEKSKSVLLFCSFKGNKFKETLKYSLTLVKFLVRKSKKDLFILRSQLCTIFGLKSRVPSSSILFVRGKGKFRSGFGKYQKSAIFLWKSFFAFLSITPHPQMLILQLHTIWSTIFSYFGMLWIGKRDSRLCTT